MAAPPWRHLGDERSLAWSLDDLGSVFRRHGDYERATPLYEESLGHLARRR